MKNQTHLMLDIETMGTAHNSAVVAIGARLFSLDSGVGKGFEVFIDPVLAQQFGEMYDDTMDWWHKQPAYELVFGGKTHPAEAIHKLNNFVNEWHPDTVWANSPSFDCVILRNLCKQVQLPFPFHYRDEMDFRTMSRLGRDLGVDVEGCWKGLTKHSPLDDATAQAMAMHRIIQHVFNKPEAPAQPDPSPPRRETLRLPSASSSTGSKTAR